MEGIDTNKTGKGHARDVHHHETTLRNPLEWYHSLVEVPAREATAKDASNKPSYILHKLTLVESFAGGLSDPESPFFTSTG